MAIRVEQNQAVPWGRDLDEYIHMFGLSEADLSKRILGCSDGPASFQAELRERGGDVVSVDPLYALENHRIKERVHAVCEMIMEDTIARRAEYCWDTIHSPDELRARRLGAMRRFLEDFPSGAGARYVCGMLPALSFGDNRFDIALCSHFLFLYSEQFDSDFHVAAIRELKRVATEVRIFPLLDLHGQPSEHLDPVLRSVDEFGLTTSILRVDYEFQAGGNEMLLVR